uniref:Uncharacterized protein n=1 Tax=Spumella elongata TaxID=89044 RepID=A0A7S3MD41_9STRA|mmetsp:Transcript_55088/g.96451  ORF Transcript_55088/g.96451 Transcript_55088/m.96451 type:complete len:361 (+) Transcript_55088:1495-2577(+)
MRLGFLRNVNAGGTSITERLGRLRFDFGQAPDKRLADAYAHRINEIIVDAGEDTEYNELYAVQALQRGLTDARDEFGNPRAVGPVNIELFRKLKAYPTPITTVDDLAIAIMRLFDAAAEAEATANSWRGGRQVVVIGTDTYAGRGNPRPQQRNLGSADTRGYNSPSANTCGRSYNGPGSQCNACAGHPDRNTENRPFLGSTIHTRLLQFVGDGNSAYTTTGILPLRTRWNLEPLSQVDLDAMHSARETAIMLTGGGGHTGLPAYVPQGHGSSYGRNPNRQGRGGFNNYGGQGGQPNNPANNNLTGQGNNAGHGGRGGNNGGRGNYNSGGRGGHYGGRGGGGHNHHQGNPNANNQAGSNQG